MLDEIYSLSHQTKVLLIFLRHLGCALNFIIAAEAKKVLKKEEKIQIFCFYPHSYVNSKTLEDVFGFPPGAIKFIPDPEKKFYKHFSVGKGNTLQVLKGGLKLMKLFPKVIKVLPWIFKVDKKELHQLPGFIILEKGKATIYSPKDIADLPKLDQFLCLEAAND